MSRLQPEPQSILLALDEDSYSQLMIERPILAQALREDIEAGCSVEQIKIALKEVGKPKALIQWIESAGKYLERTRDR